MATLEGFANHRYEARSHERHHRFGRSSLGRGVGSSPQVCGASGRRRSGPERRLYGGVPTAAIGAASPIAQAVRLAEELAGRTGADSLPARGIVELALP